MSSSGSNTSNVAAYSREAVKSRSVDALCIVLLSSSSYFVTLAYSTPYHNDSKYADFCSSMIH
jgi:hypothetical protein